MANLETAFCNLHFLTIAAEINILHIKPTVSHFYGTEYEIWAGFGPVGNTEKKKLGRL